MKQHVSLTVRVLALLLAPVAGHAHDSAASHRHSDTRMTPREAASHETGQLPASRGQETLSSNVVHMAIEGGQRIFSSNGVPDHASGPFPNRGNPNRIAAQSYVFRMPFDPAPPSQAVLSPSEMTSDRGFLFGIALNGVPFEPATGMNWTPQGVHRGGRPGPWVYEAIGGAVDFGIDSANAHVQRTGAYHYHGVPLPMLDQGEPTLLGYAADGYPIYGPLGYSDPMDAASPLMRLQPSWQLKTTARPSPPQGPGGQPDGAFTADFQFVAGSGDLDRLNGRFGVTPDYPDGVYHYVITDAFPHIPRGFAGEPDRSFFRQPGQGPNHVSARGEPLALGNR